MTAKRVGDESEVLGIVEGAPGEVVAGWARIGEARHWVRRTVRVATDDRVIEVDLARAALHPVTTLAGTWAEVEAHPAAQLCVDEAPAPDVDVTLRHVLLRGGQRFKAWGTITATTFVELTTSPGTSDVYRHGATPVATHVAAEIVAVDAAVDELDHLRARSVVLQQVLPKHAGPPDRLTAAGQERAARSAAPPRRTSRQTMQLAVLGVGILALLASLLLPLRTVSLLLACVALGMPLVVGELTLPVFRTFGATTRRPRHIVLAVLAILAAFVTLALSYSVIEAARAQVSWLPAIARRAVPPSLIASGAALALAVLVALADGGRRKRLAMVAKAPPHPSPLVDAVWGYTDGTVAFAAGGGVNVGATEVAAAAGLRLRWSGQGKQGTLAQTPFHGAAAELEVDALTVRPTGGLWLSMIEHREDTSTGREVAEVIPRGATVRVVGRARQGMIEKGGQDSLLAFVPPRGEHAAGALHALRRGWQQDVALLAIGAAGWVALLVQHVS